MQHLLQKLLAGQTLSVAESTDAFERIMTGQAEDAQVGAFLAMIQMRGPTAQEITGAARVMRQKVVRVCVPEGLTLVDTCGTGGDASGTFNISTATALVVAAAGRPRDIAVAKHGNRAITSRSGSSQVLESLGVKLSVKPETLTRCLDEVGLCFCFAPAHHPAMKHAMPVRQALGFRTLFNLLGPLTNPAGAQRQIIGVFSPTLTDVIASVLGELGSTEAMVVHGQFESSNGTTAGLDELSTCGHSHVSHLRDGQVQSYQIDPVELALPKCKPAMLRVDSPEASAAMICDVLAGVNGPARDIVCLNAAAGLLVAGLVNDLYDGLTLAAQTLDSGAARQTLDKLVKVTGSD